LFPKKRNEIPANLRRLIDAFNTIEDPIHAMKLILIKRGVKGAIALAQAHGEVVDWEKVGSSHARPLLEMLKFCKKAKKYAPKMFLLFLLWQLLRLLRLGLRRLLLAPLLLMLLRLLPPQTLLLRWHRFLAYFHRFILPFDVVNFVVFCRYLIRKLYIS
jgi:hypothetical protein